MAAILEPAHSDRTTVLVPRAPAGATASESAVSWGAIFAGAAAGAALSLILLILGVGLGLSTVSPWTGSGLSSTAVGLSTIAWVTFTQLAASAIGGYLAGRLRTKWTDTFGDEVYFRDTAHGLLTWAVATLLTAGLLTSTIASIVGAGATALASAGRATATVAAATAASAAATGAASQRGADDTSRATTGYYIDMLFRSGTQARTNGAANAAPSSDEVSVPPTSNGASLAPNATPPNAASTPVAPIMTANPAMTAYPPDENGTPVERLPLAEVTRIIGNGISRGALPDEDARYLGRLVSERTGLAPPDAEARVADVFTRLQGATHDAENTAKAAAEAARQASAYTALWLFVSLLIGAFVASLAATYGGRQRDL
jgi:hypothetical protein